MYVFLLFQFVFFFIYILLDMIYNLQCVNVILQFTNEEATKLFRRT